MESLSLALFTMLVLMLIGTSQLFPRKTLRQSRSIIPIRAIARWLGQDAISSLSLRPGLFSQLACWNKKIPTWYSRISN